MAGNHTCNVCNQPFNSDRDLQEHQRTSHNSSQTEKQQPGSDPNQGHGLDIEQDEPRRERIA
jgi:hypothetical protein